MLIYGVSSIFLLLVLAQVLDALMGEQPFRRIPHPVALAGRAIETLEAKLNVAGLSDAQLRWRGALAVAFMATLAAAIGLALGGLFRLGGWLWPLEALSAAVLLAQRSLYDHVRGVAVALEQNGLEAAREAVGKIVGRDPKTLDVHGVARAAVESLAENFSDAVVAPAFWYALLGLPGVAVYKTVSTLDSMIGHKTPRYLHFGRASARLDDLLNLVPARLAGLLITVASWAMPGADARAALAAMRRDARKHRSPNAGWPEAAMAGALNFKLAGPRQYKDETVDAPFIGPGTPDLTPADIRRALNLYVLACVTLAGGAVLGAAVLR